MFALGIALIALGLLCAYKAGADPQDRARHEAQTAAQYEAAMAPSRERHPSRRAA
jgi:hypothetical protein